MNVYESECACVSSETVEAASAAEALAVFRAEAQAFLKKTDHTVVLTVSAYNRDDDADCAVEAIRVEPTAPQCCGGTHAWRLSSYAGGEIAHCVHCGAVRATDSRGYVAYSVDSE